uniref:Integral membrane protein n=1 Tax=Streptomyces sp. NBC_00093 TaxID=2975649 RepID=A0AAU2AH28_9ACTN
MFPTTGPEASLTVVLVAVPVYSASQLLIPLFFGARPEQEVRKRHVLALAVAWPILLFGGLMMNAAAREVRAELGMGSSSSPWYLWICATIVMLLITATAVDAVRTARTEVQLRPVAEDLLHTAQLLRASLGVSTADAAQGAQHWLDEAQEALAAGRGRTAVRYLHHALDHAEDAARDDGRIADAAVVPLDSLRQRVEEIEELTGPFSGPPPKQ